MKKHINKYDDFKNQEFNMLIERLHINKDVDVYSDKIYDLIKTSESNKIVFVDLPPKLNIKKLIINIKYFKDGVFGELDLDKSKNTDDGWIIHINLKDDFKLYTLKHELNHALRLSLIGKDNMIKKINYIKSQNIFWFSKDYEMEYFFNLLYLANDEEINSKVIEIHGYIKEVMLKWNVNKLSKEDFYYIIKTSAAFKESDDLINFKCDGLFNKWSENNLNKLFYILEDNKSELDRIQHSRFKKFKLIIKSIKDNFNNKTSFYVEDDKIYKPKKGKGYYDKWIPDQGEKLRNKIYSLFDHYSN